MVFNLVIKTPLGTMRMLRNDDNQAGELPRKQPRTQVPLPQEVMNRLEALADEDSRPTANMASILIQAAIELMDEQGFKLVQGKLRKVAVLPDEPMDEG